MKRRFRKEQHEWTHEVSWNHSLPVYGEKKNDKVGLSLKLYEKKINEIIEIIESVINKLI